MTVFQKLGLLLLVAFIATSIFNLIRGRVDLRASLPWLVLWSFAALTIAHPSLVIRLATFLGIGRGADLVFYCNVLLTTFGFFLVYTRQRAHRREITLLVRELAIANASRPERAMTRQVHDESPSSVLAP